MKDNIIDESHDNATRALTQGFALDDEPMHCEWPEMLPRGAEELLKSRSWL